MQLIKIPDPSILPSVESAVQNERLMRYLPAAGGDVVAAFELYLWNCTLSESFFASLHFAEIVCRNAIHRRLVDRLGDEWFRNPTLIGLLSSRHQREIADAVRDETTQHRGTCTHHHVVSALTFGFWQHLLTKRFERLLWTHGVHCSFAAAPPTTTREDAYLLVESIRRWRNRIAHHRAIFDKRPMKMHQESLKLIRWVCADTGTWVASVSKVPLALSLRPK